MFRGRGIVDLMLSRSTRRHDTDSITHLVVELKAPKVKVNTDEISQIEGYAASVMDDQRFRNVKVSWVFWVISDDVGPHAKFRMTDESGLIHKKDNVCISVKTWGQVLAESKPHEVLQERLEYQAGQGRLPQTLARALRQILGRCL